MPNSFSFTSTNHWVSMDALRLLLNKLTIASGFDMSYQDEFKKEFAVGERVTIKKPNLQIARRGLTYNPQAIARQTTTLEIQDVIGYDLEWDDAEAALKLERSTSEIQKQYLDPAMSVIAQEIDSMCALWAYQRSNNIAGVLGTDPSSFQAFSSKARQRMVEMGGFNGSGTKIMAIPPQVNTSLKAAAIGYFNPSSELSRQYKTGSIGVADGFDWYESMSLYTHTAGTWAGAVTVNGAGQSGSSLNITCTNGDTFKKGDKIGIANCYKVNPMTHRVTTAAETFTFTVLADVTASGTSATLSIGPALVGPGSPYQNISALPANSAALTLFPGTSSPSGKVGKVGLALAPQAFALAGVPLSKPKKAEQCYSTRDPETGIEVRFIREFDPKESKWITRFDCMIALGDLYPDNCSVAVLSA